MTASFWRNPYAINLTVLATLVLGCGAAFAQSASGCATLASERITLPQGAASIHNTGSVPLHTGEILRLRMIASAQGAGTGSIALNEGGETDDLVLSGAAPQETTFTVPFDGLYALEFRTDGAGPLTFEVQCETSAAALNRAAGPQAFVERRVSRLLADETGQASLRRRENKPGAIDQAVKSSAVLDENGQPAQVSVTTSVQSLAAAEGHSFANNKLDLWVEGRVSQFEHRLEDDGVRYSADGHAGALHFGADYLLTPGLMIGGLIQLDQYREEYGALGAVSDSQGVLFGPYASVRIAPDLVFDAQMAWGPSDNESELPDGTRLAFETERQLLRGQLSGNRNLLGFQFTPTLVVSIVEDRFAEPDSFPDGSIDAESSVFGRLGVGSALSYRFALDDGGFVQPNAALSTGWNLDGFDAFGVDGGELVNENGAKAEAGVTLGMADGVSIQASGAIEGLGEEGYSAWSGRLSLTAPLN